MASILWLPVIVLTATAYLYVLSTNLPEMDYTDKNCTSEDLKFPRNLQELTSLAVLLQQYKTDHLPYVLVLFCSAYLYKQSFAIPGSVFMNLLAGALFPTWLGFIIVCTLTASGATCCYTWSKLCGKSYIVKYFPQKVNFLQEKVKENMDSLFYFLLFLRFFPMTPNWFLNMASPIVNIPVHLFFLSVFIGLVPYNFICVQTGSMLSDLRSIEDIFTPWTMIKLGFIAIMALVPGLVSKRLKKNIKTN
ncbi:transmembrane protein 41A-A-like [Ylistrum balloti]|uniref:transmembrane protein 41A-A-like n=1 Tax=Ylistrum balloti TaxID=509963 RepID=UPI0029057DAC|nr:transmembrane protein 41A-A-like [Ylistrum balloti]